MSTQTEWQQRRDTLMATLSCTQLDISARSDALASPSKRRRYAIQTLNNLLTCLRSFATDHFNHFHDTIFRLPAGSEKISGDYPPEYVLSVILDQISFDLETIEQAANHRLSHNPQVYETLEKADEIARLALEPAMAHFQLEGTRLVTYFQKSPSIRVVPYASVALIGIPYTSVNVKRDFLAIPHEVAHYLYWHGRVNGRSIHQELTDSTPKEPSWSYDWLEETFADVYGCLIAGPVIALSFQDLQLRRTPTEFIENDEDHPVPILRPNIYTKILKGYFGNWGDKLDIRWNGNGTQKGKRQERAEENKFKHRNNQDKVVEEAISTEAASSDRALTTKPVDKMIAKILAVLSHANNHNLPLNKVSWWQDYLSQATSTDDLYLAFSKNTEKIPQNDPATDDGELACTSFSTLLPQWQGRGGNSTEPAWLPILHAGGWSIKGPECEGAGPCK